MWIDIKDFSRKFINTFHFIWASICSDKRFSSGHSVSWRFGSRYPRFESYIQQKKTTCLLSICISLTSARASKLKKKHVYRHSQARKPTGSGVEWDECSLIIGTSCRVKVFTWSLIAQSICQQAFSQLAIWCLRPWVRILHSAEGDNLSPFHSNIAWLCQFVSGHSVCWRFGVWDPDGFEACIQQRKTTCLL